ncbi:MAG TPA: class I SAM-dependent methyltransferase [Thermoanaerobaculia bacterium]|nr:class I SAM-dependent methyltransferase [Thermoanaerobaculia bacterium]
MTAGDDIVKSYRSRWLQGYVKAKLRSDPVYEAVYRRIGLSTTPLLDIGCGIGLLAAYLLQRGSSRPIIGLDYDPRKIEQASRASANWTPRPTFLRQDARQPVIFQGDVVMLDVLHYLSDEDQSAVLSNAARCVEPGGYLIVRECLRDKSLRYRLTWLEERFATSIRWLKADRLNFPSRAAIEAPLLDLGFSSEVIPLSGRLPFNNHLLTFRAPVSNEPTAGITKS